MTAAIVVIIIVAAGALIYAFRDKLRAAPPDKPEPEPPDPPPPHDPAPPPTWPEDPDPVPPPPDDPEPDQPPVPLPDYVPRLTGVVRDRDTRQPLAGATIRLTHGPKAYSATTDSDGRWSITNIEPSTYWRVTTASGYQEDRAFWRVQKDTDSHITTFLVPVGIVLTLLNPTGGNDWKRGHTYSIRWHARGLDTVEVTFRHWTNSHTITRSVTGSWDRLPAEPGQYNWQIPFVWGVGEHPVEAGNYTIRVNGYKGGQYITFAESRQFTIS